MAITLITSNQKTITLEDQHFASGGEGKIHKIISPAIYKNCCVKLYDSKYRTPERQKKLTFLIQNAPAQLQNNDFMVCFPQELVFLNKQFVGFVMLLAFPDSIQLEVLSSFGVRPKYKSHAKFARNLPDAFQKRLQLCLNLAVPIHLVHQLNKYVFVDIKPQNILVSPDSKISIIDIDSIQVANNNKVIHAAQVSTADYSPPEWWHIPKGNYIAESWDRFAIAVIFYQILFGIHPYTASFKGGYAHVTEIAECIKNGLFVHGHNAGYIHVLPPPHHVFRQMDARLQRLFMAAFEGGLHDPNKRPTLDQWGQAFFDVRKKKVPIITVPLNQTAKKPPPIITAPPNQTPSGNIVTVVRRLLDWFFELMIGLIFLIIFGAFWVWIGDNEKMKSLINNAINLFDKFNSFLGN